MNTNGNYPHDYEEIDLRDILKTLNKWKITIISVTIIAMLLSGVISYFFLIPVYEARTNLLQVSNQTPADNIITPNYILRGEEGYRKIEESTLDIRIPSMDLTSYNEYVYSTLILERTLDELGLDLSVAELSKMISANKPKDQPNASITVTSKDPELAAKIANTVTSELVIYINEMEKVSYDKVMNTLKMQINNVQGDLDIAVDNLKDYRASNLGSNGEVDLIKQELEERKLQNEINRKEDLIDLLNAKVLELKITQAFTDTENKLIVLSEAYTPSNPIKPNKQLNMMIAGVLGLMVAVFGVFLAEYLREED